jgi:hypothetical protein
MKEDESLMDCSISFDLDKSKIYHLNDLNNTVLFDEYENKKIQIYDPNLDEQICCIELTNNNKIYIRYEQDWIIKDVNIN